MSIKIENRRGFLKSASLAAVAFPFLLSCKDDILAQKSDETVLSLIRKNADSSADRNGWRGAAHGAPDDVSQKAIFADKTDEGEPLKVSGTVYRQDGKQAAPNILIYAYHTNARGFYGRGNGEHPHGKHHGWMLTDAHGRYEFQTIKPGRYPALDTPAHIHFTLSGVDFKEYWIDDIWFEGDDLITPAIKKKQLSGRGGFNPIVKLEKTVDGIWHAKRDIQLWKG